MCVTVSPALLTIYGVGDLLRLHLNIHWFEDYHLKDTLLILDDGDVDHGVDYDDEDDHDRQDDDNDDDGDDDGDGDGDDDGDGDGDDDGDDDDEIWPGLEESNTPIQNYLGPCNTTCNINIKISSEKR